MSIFSINMSITENRSVILSKNLEIKRAQYATMWDFGKQSSIWTDTDGICHGSGPFGEQFGEKVSWRKRLFLRTKKGFVEPK